MNQLTNKRNYHLKTVMGDFEAKIGAHQKDVASVSKYGYRNERGDRLCKFSQWENLYIRNSFFKKNPNRK
ncbi:hypothetical protein FKM82_027901 [Ascaphus truei]